MWVYAWPRVKAYNLIHNIEEESAYELAKSYIHPTGQSMEEQVLSF